MKGHKIEADDVQSLLQSLQAAEEEAKEIVASARKSVEIMVAKAREEIVKKKKEEELQSEAEFQESMKDTKKKLAEKQAARLEKKRKEVDLFVESVSKKVPIGVELVLKKFEEEIKC